MGSRWFGDPMTDPFLYVIMLIPLFIAIIAKYGFNMKISWSEYIVQGIVGVFALSLIWFAGNMTTGYDTEIINGQLTGKRVWRFDCPTNTGNPCTNGYSCHSHQVCTTSGSGKDRTESCHEEHDTCYEYDWEQNWYVQTNLFNADEIQINRVDDQGARKPQRWDIAKVGDPASSTHSYRNWVKASADSMFKEDGKAEEQYM